jgi:hypothetical protein
LHDVEVPDNSIVKFSARLYIPDNDEFGGAKVRIGDYWNRICDNLIWLSNGWCVLELTEHTTVNVPAPVPAGEWFDYHFVADFAEMKLLEVGMGGDTVTYDEEYFSLLIHSMNSISIIGVSTNGVDPCGLCIDNVTVEEIPEPMIAWVLLLMLALGWKKLNRR